MSDLPELFSTQEVSLKDKVALITGASVGIGRATAAWLAREGVHLFLVARRKEKLELLKEKLVEQFPKVKITIICADINEKNFIAYLEKLGALSIDILINNAGLALGRETVFNLNEVDIRQMIETNITSLFSLTSAVSKKMVEKRSGHIVNLGSIAGHYTYEGGSVYCATKFAVRAFTQALRQELYDKNVRVSLISPGAVKTDFSLVRYRGDEEKAAQVYENIKCLLDADIARVIIKTLKEPEHVCYDEVVVLPTVQSPVNYKFKKS